MTWRCDDCGHTNPDGMGWCSQCVRVKPIIPELEWVWVCDGCGETNSNNVKWCYGCRPDKRPKASSNVSDVVNHPPHYTNHPSGIECIQITEHMGFCLGNAIKYVWRAGIKSHDALDDLRKARWYIDREIARLETEKKK